MSPFYLFRRALARRFFTSGYRLRFYRMLSLQMRNGVKLLDALEQISNMYTDFGRRTHGFGFLVDDCRVALTDNSGDNSLEHALANWVPAEEAALISAGMFSGRLPEALAEAEILIDCRRRIRNAVLRMSIYPLGCALMLLGTLLAIKTELIPTLAGMSDPQSWSGALGMLNDVLLFFSEHGVVTGAGLALVLVWIRWSLPNWIRPDRLRRLADRRVPWAVYSDIQGAIFLINMGALLCAEVKTLTALQVIQRFASPWLTVRLDAVMQEVEEGASFGMALRECGYAFPSKEAVNYLSMVDGDGAAQMIARFGQEWLEETVKRVNRRGIVVMLLSMVMLFSLIGVVVVAVMEVNSMTQSLGQY
ncbi:pilus assembly protein PilR [Salmonella enterica subsp. enterica serovar Sandiego]|nr:pilus assembly protein PilR [Salmonella enterica]EFU6400708.1 pilus assembly protein PilR [Salmonella enterica]EHF0507821.1 pilus assembly protein PilR [Salmonella enterica subsp. enterica serovar Sandiego]